ncbi:fructose-2,6-bisphosphatase [Clostridium aceticum]|uniref:Fructose-2,6-bisphosphatase n=1 Tax=Clostridium aceticum TaxID=84022 RepID=A0A0D8II04_9CLOT|nr:histidine phosphatase family protein [Clostridium aceticum]AKL95400.1 fructose-2,6-bisphosphatase [Clostridium aceticum]KJF28796.1 phosphoglycerate mutase [Clostridium aceticum]
MKKLYIVRHGETNWNLLGKTQGIQDSELTKKGLIQAHLLADRLLKENIEIIYTSYLNRAKSTAMIIKSQLKVPCYYEEGLNEMNFGKWEGLTHEEILQSYPKEFKKWRNFPQEASIPEGEDLKFAQKRIVKFVEKLLITTEKNRILLISHSTIIKLLLLHVLNMDLSNYYRLKQDNCSINIIDYREYGPVLLQYNDTCHIKA